MPGEVTGGGGADRNRSGSWRQDAGPAGEPSGLSGRAHHSRCSACAVHLYCQDTEDEGINKSCSFHHSIRALELSLILVLPTLQSDGKCRPNGQWRKKQA